MSTVQPPVVVIPGITGTGLEDFYPVPPEELWSAVLHKKHERIALHPENIRYEAIEPARVQPTSLFGLIYVDLIEALRHDLTRQKDKPTPVFGFSYDWRQDCASSVEQLRDFIDEVLARTSLLPHYRSTDGSPIPNFRVDLVGHSMGGLIAADYLYRYGKKGRVRRVVSIGAPFEGAPDSVEKLATGMGTLSGVTPRDREREAARTIPSIYQLLPTFKGAVSAAKGLSDDLFQVTSWQPSILRTLAEYIRLHAARISPEKLLGQFLEAAKRLRSNVRKLTLKDMLPEGPRGWLAIVGIDAPTRLRVNIVRWNKEFGFDFPAERNEWSKDSASTATGDGTVPFLGACPAFLSKSQLVCISPREFDRLEIQDRILAKMAGFHAALPSVNLVQRIVLRFLCEQYDGDVEARRAPGVTTVDWPKWLIVKR